MPKISTDTECASSLMMVAVKAFFRVIQPIEFEISIILFDVFRLKDEEELSDYDYTTIRLSAKPSSKFRQQPSQRLLSRELSRWPRVHRKIDKPTLQLTPSSVFPGCHPNIFAPLRSWRTLLWKRTANPFVGIMWEWQPDSYCEFVAHQRIVEIFHRNQRGIRSNAALFQNSFES